MKILCLLDCRFYIAANDCIEVSGFPNVLEDAFVAYFASVDVDAAQVEDNFA